MAFPPHLLNLVSNNNSYGSEDNKLDLTLGPPGGAQKGSSLKHTCNEHVDSMLSLGGQHRSTAAKSSWPSSAKFLQFPVANDAGKESSLHHCNSTKTDEVQTRNNNDSAATEKIGFLPSVGANTAVPQQRTASGPVVGWPPIRSFRKNLASTSTKQPSPEADNEKLDNHGKKAAEAITSAEGLFVKINMDGIPIGRKVNLNAYGSYEKLASVVDQLFRGLAAQTDSFANGIPSNLKVGKPITGLLDGNGEYTLVYEDNEGDKVLVGDVPWRMFVSTVKRLRVLKTSELPSLSLGCKHKMMQP